MLWPSIQSIVVIGEETANKSESIATHLWMARTSETLPRGYLLPRMQNYADKWTPFLNTVLFSVYHLFSPWENLIRIIGFYPVVYLVWRKKDIRFGIFTHVILNTLGGSMMVFVLLRV